MIDYIAAQNPIFQAFLATVFTWGMTAIGSAGVFFFKKINQKILDSMLGFAAGVMIAASFWSLLSPSIALSEDLGNLSWFAPAVGFLLGGGFLWLIDKLMPHVHIGKPKKESEGLKTSWSKTFLLFLAVTIHNIPEGLAVGVAFGSLGADIPGATLAGALSLAFGIGIQNFPEGFAISMPFRREGVGRFKSFMYGQGSALVEPIAAILGASLVLVARPILPYALAFAAGAMIYVTIEEIIPESQSKGNVDIATMGAMLGFVVMMVLDVALG